MSITHKICLFLYKKKEQITPQNIHQKNCFLEKKNYNKVTEDSNDVKLFN